MMSGTREAGKFSVLDAMDSMRRGTCPLAPWGVFQHNAPMLDIRLVRENADRVREKRASRGAGDEKQVDELVALDEKRRTLLTEVETLKSQRNRVSKEIGALMGQKKVEEAEAKKRETRTIGDKITELDKAVAEVESARDEILLRIPNLPHDSVVVGKSAEENPEIRVWGASRGHRPHRRAQRALPRNG